MVSILYSLFVLALVACFAFMPKKHFFRPPSKGNDDDGGEPLQDDVPDLDLPPGITLPINDFEPDYNKPKTPLFPKPQVR